MSSAFKRVAYPLLATWLYSICPLLTYFVEVDRVGPQYQQLFFILKMAFGVIGILQGLYFVFVGFGDGGAVILFTQMVAYALTMMWFAPIYEVAYFQCAIGCSFLNLRRKWIFPTIYGFGLLGIFANYEIMEAYHWPSPVAEKADWIGSGIVFFLLSWFIQKFAIGSYRKEQDRLARFSIIGKETTKLTHDIKGLLSSPLLIFDSLRNKEGSISIETYRSQMNLLAQDMENIHDVLRSMNRLVAVSDSVEPIGVLKSIKGSLRVLERRMSRVKLVLPDERMIRGNNDRLHSVFFNLLLNSLEAFDANNISDPGIAIFWHGDALIYQDNAGGISEGPIQKQRGTGLGLELVRYDLEAIGASIRISSTPPTTRIALNFSK